MGIFLKVDIVIAMTFMGHSPISCMFSLKYYRIGIFPDVTRSDMGNVFLD